jgi:membrane protein YqaA with SNARE-associated domain
VKREKLRHYANVLSSHADAHWVTPLFFLLFFVDAVILVIPVDTLLAATVSLKPQQKKKWVISSILGYSTSLALVAILVNSHLQPYLFEMFNRWGYLNHVRDLVEHAQSYGYFELTVAVFTLVPALFGVLIGVLLGLNPWAAWAISLAGKIAKILVTVWLIFSSSQYLKKWLRIWLKTSV